VCIPETILLICKIEIWCPKCGAWQVPVRIARGREVINQMLGLPLDFERETGDEPPFLSVSPHVREGVNRWMTTTGK
jgi:hypothetical protein